MQKRDINLGKQISVTNLSEICHKHCTSSSRHKGARTFSGIKSHTAQRRLHSCAAALRLLRCGDCWQRGIFFILVVFPCRSKRTHFTQATHPTQHTDNNIQNGQINGNESISEIHIVCADNETEHLHSCKWKLV